jgi:carbon-monoxide dehydrogenase small subunit
VEDQAMLSCMLLTIECNVKKITTIEGLANPKTGALDPLQHSCVAFLQGATDLLWSYDKT